MTRPWRLAVIVGWSALAAQLGFVVTHGWRDVAVVLGPTSLLVGWDGVRDMRRALRERRHLLLERRLREERRILDRWAAETHTRQTRDW